jgi:predicted RNA binding protein YcfA (HicA-like mRNA interferase family)
LHAAKITCVWRYETIGTRKKRRFCVLTARKPDRTESKKDMSCEVDRETLALLTQSGFKYVRHGKHAIFRHDSGEQFSVSTSPSRERLKKIRSEINRALRRIEQRAGKV